MHLLLDVKMYSAIKTYVLVLHFFNKANQIIITVDNGCAA